MVFVFLIRGVFISSFSRGSGISVPLGFRNLCSRASSSSSSMSFHKQIEETPSPSVVDHERNRNVPRYKSRVHLSPLLSDHKPILDPRAIEVVDVGAWRISAGLAQAWQGSGSNSQERTNVAEVDEEDVDDDEGDFGEIDDMRIRGNLFYKLDRASKEFEEYSFDFHRRKSPKRKEDPKEIKKEKPNKKSDSKNDNEKLLKVEKSPYAAPPSLGNETHMASTVTKKLRAPTFNQLTAPYHEPFCLDIYISKASVRVCVVHRVTSKVVAVAHSISKDMKFDLSSTRNAAACSAVGRILAQRALADDIHDVVYTPRKGETLEGKLNIVLQSIIDSGVNVKVKLKQRGFKKVNSHLK